MRKPDKDIFTVLLNKLDAPAERCIFIDNSPDNLAAAQSLGMTTILFNRDRNDFWDNKVNSFDELIN